MIFFKKNEKGHDFFGGERIYMQTRAIYKEADCPTVSNKIKPRGILFGTTTTKNNY